MDQELYAESPRAPAGPQTLRVLWEVLAAVRDAAGYPDVLSRICEALTRAVPCDRATIYVWSRRRRAFLPIADHGTPGEVAQDFVRRGFGAGAFPGDGELRAGRGVSAVRGETDPALEEVLALARLHALAVLPLAFQERALGSLACGLDRPPAFSPEQLVLLQAVAPQIAGIIHNARLEARAGRLADRRSRLATWAAEVLGAVDLDQMAARLCEASRALFGASLARLLVIENGALVGRSVAGAEPGPAFRLPLDGEAPSTDALRTGQVLVLNRFQDTRYAPAMRSRTFHPLAVLAAPLADAGGPLGVLQIADFDNPFRFGPTDEEDARLLASIATVALRKGFLVEALTRANSAKSEFLASVSHDLRTPLNVIIGYTQLLAEETFGPVTPEQADALARVLRTARGQVGLIGDLLDLARIEQGKLACRLDAVPVAGLVPSLREMMEALLCGRPVAFDADVAADAVAWTDPERLRQILVNLLTNAAKFTESGHVRLSGARVGACVEIRVADTGAGMDSALAARALEPFVRGDGVAAGSGLGLAIVARLLQVLDGTLDIASAPGAGTTVTLTLPTR